MSLREDALADVYSFIEYAIACCTSPCGPRTEISNMAPNGPPAMLAGPDTCQDGYLTLPIVQSSFFATNSTSAAPTTDFINIAWRTNLQEKQGGVTRRP